MTSKTTVVIVTHNRATSLARTLLELSKLRPVPPIVVVDNASTDDTANVVDAARSVIPALTTITRSSNEGAAARNYGVSAASTPYIAFCDDDSWWDRDALPSRRRCWTSIPPSRCSPPAPSSAPRPATIRSTTSWPAVRSEHGPVPPAPRC
ncbi:glycosyltransferase family 2 protein [Rhodococcus sp. ZPP]|uniref:glycosyltransferase family 2 protein n=1 Tax=Rhodococcus sp. ZPP TaxID=2749906 RepID=UPI001AD855DC|nr:glycosyltransferase family 2 protein [Rhodococcus sp. ZPP]QTJ64177.1 glycosyltransferase family 2 protein [Rhodococcus sp. ZPP]